MISVIIATKNGERYISRAIQNALSQSVAIQNAKDATLYAGFEIVVISDGSTDKTADIVRAIGERDSRVKLLELTINVGPGLARAKGIEFSNKKNPYIALLDDDDQWANIDKLKNQSGFLDKHPNILAVGAHKTEFVTEEGRHILWYFNSTSPAVLRKNMLARNPIVNSSVMYRRDSYEKIGGYRDMRLSEDYDLWLRLGLIGDVANIEGAETSYTLSKNSMSASNGAQSKKVAQIVLNLIREYKGKYPNYWLAASKGYARLLLQSTIGVSFLARIYSNLKSALRIR